MKSVITLLLASVALLVAHTQVNACDLDPTAVIEISPNDAVFSEGYTVAFLGYFSMSNCGYLTDYRWQIDGVTEQAGGSFFTHSFTLPSGVELQNFDIQLRVRNSVNNYDYETVTITIVREHSSYYYLTDHLGSVRVTVDDDGNAVGWDDYYPFGLQMPGRTQNASNPNDDAKFTGYLLEQDGDLGLYHAEARMYDPVIGRFIQVDPLANEYASWSPYNYTLNNPISYTDPDGKCPTAGNLFCIGMQQGFKQSVTSSYEGIKGLITDFSSTMGALGDAISNPGETIAAISEGVSERVDMATSGNPLLMGQVAGEGLALTGEVILGAKGSGAVTNTVRGLKVADNATDGVEIVQRAMSTAELNATTSTGLIRGGREGTHFVSNSISTDPLRARQRLSLGQTPEVRVTLEVPSGYFSSPSRVAPLNNMPGGGIERTATGNIQTRIIGVYKYKQR